MRIVAALPVAATLPTPSKAPPPPTEAAAPAAGLADEGERGLHLRVLGEVHHHRHVDRAAALVEPVAAGPHPPREPADVLHQEGREVDQHAVVRFAAATVKPHSVDGANASSTALRSAGLSLLARKR